MTSVMPVSDRVLDANSYEMAPLQYWGPIWRHAAGRIAERVTEPLRADIGNDFCFPEHKGDDTAIGPRHTSSPVRLLRRHRDVQHVLGID
jgi:hypothetical protein